MSWKKFGVLMVGLLVVPASVSLATYEWTGNGSNRLWSNPDNWDTAGGPTSSWAWCDVTPNGGGPLITKDVTAIFGSQMDLGWNGTSAVTVLDMTGGSLTGGNLTVGQYPYAPNYYGAVMNMSGGAVSLTRSFAVGARTTGVFNMTGGTVDCVGGLQISQGAGTASGDVHLDGGTFTAAYLLMCYNGAAAGTAHLDITDGKLVLTETDMNKLNTYIANGWITGYGDSSKVVITPVGSTVEITAVPEPATLGLILIGSFVGYLRKKA